MTAKEYAALSSNVYAIASKVKPDDRSPVAQSANVACLYLRMAAAELKRLAEWQAEHEGKAANA